MVAALRGSGVLGVMRSALVHSAMRSALADFTISGAHLSTLLLQHKCILFKHKLGVMRCTLVHSTMRSALVDLLLAVHTSRFTITVQVHTLQAQGRGYEERTSPLRYEERTS